MGVLTVSQINFYVKSLFDGNEMLSDIFVAGEISNFKHYHKSGHFYFSLKDEKSILKCVMFGSYANNVRFMPEDGMQIVVRGKIGIYEATGQYQLYVYDMLQKGIGDSSIEIEKLKEKLKNLGYFDREKKSIPMYPKKVGIITAKDSAALSDIKRVASRRFPATELYVLPVTVQGEYASKELAQAVRYFSKSEDIDVIVIARGGGSKEDLSAFNSEELANAMYDCPIPIISGVGHESDLTICDLVADLRASTPSAAMELCLPDKNNEMERIKLLQDKLGYQVKSILGTKAMQIDNLKSRLTVRSLLGNVEKNRFLLHTFEVRLEQVIKSKIRTSRENVDMYARKLETYNPERNIADGLAAVLSDDGKRVTDINSFEKGQKIRLMVSGGYVHCRVENVEKNGD